jgi:hypothetical protein
MTQPCQSPSSAFASVAWPMRVATVGLASYAFGLNDADVPSAMRSCSNDLPLLALFNRPWLPDSSPRTFLRAVRRAEARPGVSPWRGRAG